MSNNDELAAAVGLFTEAEGALRQLHGRSEQVSQAGQRLSEAQSALVEARQRLRAEFANDVASATEDADRRVVGELENLERATSALDRVARELETTDRSLSEFRVEIQSLALSLGDSARELKSAAISLQDLKPQRVYERLDDLAKSGSRQLTLMMLIAVLVVALGAVVVFVA